MNAKVFELLSLYHYINFMFGWGKKKKVKETIVGNDEISSNAHATSILEPIAVLVGVVNSENQIEQAKNAIEKRASFLDFIEEIQTTIDGVAIAATLMVKKGQNREIIFAPIHEAAIILAGEISHLGQCFLVKTDENGGAIETLQIEPQDELPQTELSRGLFSGLKRSSQKLAQGIGAIFTTAKLDDDSLEELEELLILSDMGVENARNLCKAIAARRFEQIDEFTIRAALADEIAKMLLPFERFDNPWSGDETRVIMFVGVNGSGKTTTIGKIAQNLVDNDHEIMLAAADTFRAAASEQLLVWGKRAGVEVIAKESGADSAGLAYEALQKARALEKGVLLIDTAGRLQNKSELMAELEKIVRVIKKLDPTAPHEVWLVLDATVGQNAISQAEAFAKTAGITGLIMSKLDGTAKGGVLLALTQKFALPIRFIGVGERVEDLQPFSARTFARALVGLE